MNPNAVAPINYKKDNYSKIRNYIKSSDPYQMSEVSFYLELKKVRELSSDDYIFMKLMTIFAMRGKHIEYLDTYFKIGINERLEELMQKDHILGKSYILGYMKYVETQHRQYLEALNFTAGDDDKETYSKHDIDRRKSEYSACKTYLKDIKDRFTPKRTAKKSRNEVFEDNTKDEWGDM